MRLINPSAGEILDRLTILQLKIDYAKAERKPIEHFLTEQKLCKAAFAAIALPDGYDSQLKSWVKQLSTVNSRLWTGIDQIRMTSWWRVVRLARLSKKVQYLNEIRAELVHLVDAWVSPNAGKEKLW